MEVKTDSPLGSHVMLSSGRKFIALLLLLTAIVSANSQTQTAVDKSSNSTISGKVTLGGKGVPGLVVGLTTTTSRGTYFTPQKGVTDKDGNYRIKNVPPGNYQMLVSMPHYVLSERSSVVVGKNDVIENINLTLLRGGVITGKVTDADGRPVVEQHISFSSTTPSNAFPYFRIIRTDDRGVYRAFGLPPGRYIVSAGQDSTYSAGRAETGYQRTYHPSTVNEAEATAVEVNEGSEATNVDITLGRKIPKYVARGRIIDGETLQPLPNEQVGILILFGNNGSATGRPVKSTKNGEFKFENLTPGKYDVYLESQANSQSFSEPVRFEVIDQDIDGLLIKTSKGGSVSGVVVLEGAHDPGVNLNPGVDQIAASFANESGRRIPSVSINQDGSFQLTGLPAGRLTLQLLQARNRFRLIRIERDGVVYPGSIEIKEREQITGLRVVLSEASGKIRGVLKLPEGFELPATAQLFVWVRRMEDPTFPFSPVTANARGRFLIEGLVPGTYEFHVRVLGAPGERQPSIPRPTQTVVVTNGAIADVTITLQKPKPVPSGP